MVDNLSDIGSVSGALPLLIIVTPISVVPLRWIDNGVIAFITTSGVLETFIENKFSHLLFPIVVVKDNIIP